MLLALQDALLEDPTASDGAKGKVLNALAEVDKALSDGSDEYLQLLGVASYCQKTLAAA